nr:MAG TPA: hypothetical protein [Caudoviricetes sp.]
MGVGIFALKGRKIKYNLGKKYNKCLRLKRAEK